MVPRRRAHRAPDPRLHPLERRDHGQQGQPQGPGGRRAHRHLPERRQPVRGRLQPLLPGQGPSGRRRPRLHPGPRVARHLRPGLPRGPADRRPPRRLPPGGLPRPGQGPVLLPAPAVDADLLGVPDGLDGPDRDQLDLPGPVQPLPAQPGHQGHLQSARLGVHGRRRDGRAGVARRHPGCRPGGAGQPHLRDQLQPAAAGRTGAAATARSSRSWSRSSSAPAGT